MGILKLTSYLSQNLKFDIIQIDIRSFEYIFSNEMLSYKFYIKNYVDKVNFYEEGILTVAPWRFFYYKKEKKYTIAKFQRSNSVLAYL